MAFDPALPTTRDQVRLALGDTSTTQPLLQDETYDAVLLALGDDEKLATIQLARALAARYAQEPDEVEQDGKTRARWRDRVATWLKLAETLQLEVDQAARKLRVHGPKRQDREEEASEYYAGQREW